LPQGTITLGPITISPTTDNLTQDVNFTMAMGNTVIDVPSWAVGAIIIPNPTNTVAMVISTSEILSGVNLSPSAPSLISFPSPPPTAITFIVTSAVTTTTTVTFF
jgi:hypothetical protein